MIERKIVTCRNCGAIIGDSRYDTQPQLAARKFCFSCMELHRRIKNAEYQRAYRARKKAARI